MLETAKQESRPVGRSSGTWLLRSGLSEAQRRVLTTGGQPGCVVCEEARRELRAALPAMKRTWEREVESQP